MNHPRSTNYVKFPQVGFLRLLIILLGGAIGIVPSARACAIPVFRYALERWGADAYELVVFHRGPLEADQQAVLDWIEEAAPEDWTGANARLITVDLEGEVDEGMQRLWGAQSEPTLPWVVALGPATLGSPGGPVWSEPLDHRSARAMVDSPARRIIADRILDGESAVWVFLDSGDQEKDDPAHRLLEAQLAELQRTLKIEGAEEPADTDDEDISGPGDLQSPLALRVAFSIIRLSRTDPAERMFVKMLLGAEDDLKTYDAPMAFPVFGRGRALYALVGKGINEINIREACEFLVGWISCEIKAQNPGTDMLMFVDWDARVGGLTTESLELPPLRGMSGVLSLTGEEEPPAAEAKAPDAGGASGTLLRNALLAVGLVIVGVVILAFFLRRQTGRS